MKTNNPEIYTEYCPDCVIELKQDDKMLGDCNKSHWLICSKCGFRKRPENWTQKVINHLATKDYKRNMKAQADVRESDKSN